MNRYSVLDFSRLLPGPFATRRLRDLGMRVTVVEFPQMPETSRVLMPALFAALNAGKKRLLLDPRKPAGRRRIEALAARADVLVESFRPGVMERLGLGYAKLRRLNPRLVYCSLPGYRHEKAGHDLNFLAQSGWLGLTDPPRMPAAPVADMFGAMAAVEAILAALLQGRGRRLVVPLTEAAHAQLAIPLAFPGDPGEAPRWWNGGHPFYGLYRAKDGRWLAVGGLEKRFSLALLDFLGLERLKPLVDDAEKNGPVLRRALARAFRSRTSAEFEATDFCVTPVLTLDEARKKITL